MTAGLFTNKHVVVTGGAGFIGSELTRQLVEAGANVLVIDNLVNGKEANIADIPATDRWRLEIKDIRDHVAMKRLLSGVDVVFHLATLGVRHSIHSPLENHEVNADATLRLLMIARELSVSRFVQVSTSEVYGTAQTVPMTENHPTFPMTVYGASKLAGECYARAFWRTYGYPATVVRPFNSYGPRSHHEGDSGEVIPKFMLRTLAGLPMVSFGDGTQTRDFTYVSDTARGILLAGVHESAIGKTINIGQGKEISILDLAQAIREVTQHPDSKLEHIEERPGDVKRLYSDSTFARETLGFAPTVRLQDGLLLLKRWYEKTGSSYADLLKAEKLRGWLKE